MLIPIVFAFVLLSAVLVVLGVVKKSGRILMAVSIVWWVCSLVSAFFVGWAWLERAYSENWAMYGFFFISLPIIVTTGVMAVAAIVAARLRKIDNMKHVAISLYLLLLFLAAQLAVGIMAG
jgi:hypothetical protein